MRNSTSCGKFRLEYPKSSRLLVETSLKQCNASNVNLVERSGTMGHPKFMEEKKRPGSNKWMTARRRSDANENPEKIGEEGGMMAAAPMVGRQRAR